MVPQWNYCVNSLQSLKFLSQKLWSGAVYKQQWWWWQWWQQQQIIHYCIGSLWQSQVRQKRNIFWKIYFQYLEGNWIYPHIQLSLCPLTSYLLQYVQLKSSGKLFQFFDHLERLSRKNNRIHTITRHMKKFPSLLCKYTRELLSCRYSSLHLLDINLLAVTSHSNKTNEKWRFIFKRSLHSKSFLFVHFPKTDKNFTFLHKRCCWLCSFKYWKVGPFMN